ncbi:hypothetical protein E2C01_088370 [Portunus trituberculatus]|uniref:Uncharacterized protein n=1 Tax=Portunus trituberculatus TaxID=210409 RepID=A0A5B7JJ71_PORTR|nr:hypothetical protein [Portunus trituberculatus]
MVLRGGPESQRARVPWEGAR